MKNKLSRRNEPKLSYKVSTLKIAVLEFTYQASAKVGPAPPNMCHHVCSWWSYIGHCSSQWGWYFGIQIHVCTCPACPWYITFGFIFTVLKNLKTACRNCSWKKSYEILKYTVHKFFLSLVRQSTHFYTLLSSDFDVWGLLGKLVAWNMSYQFFFGSTRFFATKKKHKNTFFI